MKSKIIASLVVLIALSIGIFSGIALKTSEISHFNKADINHDSKVDVKDLSIVAGQYGGPAPVKGDLNGDGKVDALDLSILSSNWSK